jgi:hypothetical protein
MAPLRKLPCSASSIAYRRFRRSRERSGTTQRLKHFESRSDLPSPTIIL